MSKRMKGNKIENEYMEEARWKRLLQEDFEKEAHKKEFISRHFKGKVRGSNGETGISGNRGICGQRGADGQREYRDCVEEASFDQGGARHGQDHAGGGRGEGSGEAADHMEHQVHHQGPGGAVCVRHHPAAL
mgnify:CR=1 FL=1